MLFYAMPHCAILCDAVQGVLYCILVTELLFYCTALYCTVLYWTLPYYTVTDWCMRPFCRITIIVAVPFLELLFLWLHYSFHYVYNYLHHHFYNSLHHFHFEAGLKLSKVISSFLIEVIEIGYYPLRKSSETKIIFILYLCCYISSFIFYIYAADRFNIGWNKKASGRGKNIWNYFLHMNIEDFFLLR